MLKRFARYLYRKIPFKRQVFHALRRFPIPEPIYRHFQFAGPFSVSLPGGGRFLMNQHHLRIENELFWDGYGNRWEGTSLLIWEVLARSSQCTLDIGANTGTYALAAKAANPRARVEAFEPVQRIHQLLAENAALNGNEIATHCLALSDIAGTATLYDDGNEHTYSASLNPSMQGKAGMQAKVELEVDTLDLFAVKSGLTKVELIKIDTEMHEPNVLRGGASVIADNSPAMLIEILNGEIGKAIQSLLPSYTFFAIVEGEGLRRSEKPGVHGERNYLALPNGDWRVDLIGNELPVSRRSKLEAPTVLNCYKPNSSIQRSHCRLQLS